jgi:hypothetical protein
MTRQFQIAIGWYAKETVAAALPYGGVIGTIPTVSANVAAFAAGSYISAIANNAPAILSVGNLLLITKIGRQNWGGAVGALDNFWNGMGCLLYFKVSTAGAGGGWKIAAADNSGTVIATGITEFAWASSANALNLSVLREATRLRVWINGIKEIDVSSVSSTAWDGATFSSIGCDTLGLGHTGNAYIGQVLRMSTDTADDYLDPTGFVSAAVIGNAAGTDSDFSIVVPANSSTWDDVDDWFPTSRSGTATGATTGPPGTMTDSGASWPVNGLAGEVVTAGGKTMTIATNTATVLTGTAGWSGGGNPGAVAYTIAGSGAADDATTTATDAGTANNTFRMYLATATPTCPNTVGLMHYMRNHPTFVGSKTTKAYSGVGDGSGSGGTGKTEVLTATFASNVWTTTSCVFAFTGWTLVNLQLGVRHDVGTAADALDCTALFAEVFGCTFLSDRRRYASIV